MDAEPGFGFMSPPVARGAGAAPAPPPTPGAMESESLRHLILQKQRELEQMSEYRVAALERTVKEKDDEIARVREEFRVLREDFQYNLQLIAGRDAELDQYDKSFNALQATLRQRETALAEQQTMTQTLESKLTAANNRADTLHEKCRQLEKQLGDLDIQQRRQLEDIHRDFSKRIKVQEDEANWQRSQLSETYNKTLNQLNEEHKAALRDLHTQHATASQAAEERRLAIEAKDRQIAELKARVGTLETAVDQFQRQQRSVVSKLEEETKQHEQALAKARAEVEHTHSTLVQEYEQKLTGLLQNLHEVERAFNEHKARSQESATQAARDNEALLRKAQAAYQITQAKAVDLEQQLQRANERTQETEHVAHSQVALLQSKLNEELHRTQALQRELDDMRKRHMDSESAAQSAAARDTQMLYQVQQQLSTAQDEYRRLKSESDLRVQQLSIQAQDHAREMDQLHQQWQDKLAQHQRERAGLETKIKGMEQQLTQVTGRYQSELSAKEDRILELEGQINGLSDQLRMARLAPSPEPVRRSVPEGHRDLMSPAFTDDLGPASPMQSFMSMDRGLGVAQSQDRELNALRAENDRFRQEFGRMRADADLFVSTKEELIHLRQRCPALEEECGRLRNQIHQQYGEIERLQRELQETHIQLEEAQKHAAELARLNAELAHGPGDHAHRPGLNGPPAPAPKVGGLQLASSAFLGSFNERRADAEPSPSPVIMHPPVRGHVLGGAGAGAIAHPVAPRETEGLEWADLPQHVPVAVPVHYGVDGWFPVPEQVAVRNEEVERLRAQITTATQDLQAMVDERERLMQYSNRLKADLAKALSAMQAGGNTSVQAAVQAANQEAAARFASQLQNIEQRVRTLSEENKALRMQRAEMEGRVASATARPPAQAPAPVPLPPAATAHSSVHHTASVVETEADATAALRAKISKVKESLEVNGRPAALSRPAAPPIPSSAAARQRPSSASASTSRGKPPAAATTRAQLLQERRHLIRNYNELRAAEQAEA